VTSNRPYKAIVIGTSAGGLHALTIILEKLPPDYPLPIIVVQHRLKDQRDLLEDILQSKCRIRIKQVDEKEMIMPGFVYIAPPDYHLLVEMDHSFSLSSDERVRYSRPSIDVLFESAAIVFKNELIAIILTGANNDGTAGILTAKNYGALTIAQDPGEAEYSMMPSSSIEANGAGHILSLEQIRAFLLKIIGQKTE
jgi:two-component system, chemotaxis family, protein-glutamate methylesterase/glutaminase